LLIWNLTAPPAPALKRASVLRREAADRGPIEVVTTLR
jgi:hypothetical protein